jgi:hypothetical protein
MLGRRHAIESAFIIAASVVVVVDANSHKSRQETQGQQQEYARWIHVSREEQIRASREGRISSGEPLPKLLKQHCRPLLGRMSGWQQFTRSLTATPRQTHFACYSLYATAAFRLAQLLFLSSLAFLAGSEADATTMTTAKINAGILRFAQNDKQKQIPFGNDKQKGQARAQG